MPESGQLQGESRRQSGNLQLSATAALHYKASHFMRVCARAGNAAGCPRKNLIGTTEWELKCRGGSLATLMHLRCPFAAQSLQLQLPLLHSCTTGQGNSAK